MSSSRQALPQVGVRPWQQWAHVGRSGRALQGWGVGASSPDACREAPPAWTPGLRGLVGRVWAAAMDPCGHVPPLPLTPAPCPELLPPMAGGGGSSPQQPLCHFTEGDTSRGLGSGHLSARGTGNLLRAQSLSLLALFSDREPPSRPHTSAGGLEPTLAGPWKPPLPW